MIVDASAIVAIIRKEIDAPAFSAALEKAQVVHISAANYFEAAIVVDGSRDPALSRMLDEIVAEAGIIIEPITERQARIAREAYRDYGKGSGHRAGLNFGDCFAYALARDLGEPLLYKGTDFAETDVRSALR
ncbi:MAG TPA: type II toxin-antitoxin system VapC family toxin [Bauldia sp.]|nr:type II toxin-antitoxin system VapC family toxin [Bauldia sp.]